MAKRSSKQSERIPAIGYLRKSTKGKRPDGRERQEKSISQQKTEIKKLAKRLGYRIVDWYADEGISGWKMGHERPSYDRLLHDAASNRNFIAIFVDNLDRLSRATPFKVAADLNHLAEAGVADIFCANGDRYHIKDEHNYGEVFRIVAVLMGNAEYSRQLGRRVAIAHRNNAMQGKITGDESAM